ncbi:diguanylate cyclase [Desulfuromonas acetoxidans]|uniref:sensor domain-containing diguanylate cyclase n=1 Tax=Desulfuromonas acetoxidans TaxID=891 RepID=UPI0029310C7B|nr:diguanylate cyclase [Desulfuromonas acetoxidans]
MSIRGRIISMVLLLEIVLMVTAALLFFNEHKKREHETLFYIGNSLKNHFERNARETEQRYSSRVAGFVKSNPAVIDAFIRKDSARMVHLLERKVETLHKEDDFFYCITFVFSDGTIFYHSKDLHRIGQNVASIPFAREGFESRKPVSGLVLSLAGLAYRYSYPVFDQERYVGMIVLVVKPTRAITMLADDYNAECGIFVDRKYVARFEDKNVREIKGQALVAWQGKSFSDAGFTEALFKAKALERFEFSGQIYRRFAPLPIQNYRGEKIGEVLTALNTTKEYHEFRASLMHAGGLFFCVFILTLMSLFGGTGFFLKQVRSLQESLELKVAKRTSALQALNETLSFEIQERKKAQRALKELSEKDVLTGIYNRRKFNTYYETEWSAARREGRVLSLLMIDIDLFKIYNDRYGHLAGDQALHQVAITLNQTVSRPRDFVARYGGEEFICLLPETSQQAAVQLAETMRQHVEDLHYIHEFSDTANVITVSIGVASVIPEKNQAKEELIDLADKALYLAKRDGRNCTRIA